jgi:hypothetical protein
MFQHSCRDFRNAFAHPRLERTFEYQNDNRRRKALLNMSHRMSQVNCEAFQCQMASTMNVRAKKEIAFSVLLDAVENKRRKRRKFSLLNEYVRRANICSFDRCEIFLIETTNFAFALRSFEQRRSCQGEW